MMPIKNRYLQAYQSLKITTNPTLRKDEAANVVRQLGQMYNAIGSVIKDFVKLIQPKYTGLQVGTQYQEQNQMSEGRMEEEQKDEAIEIQGQFILSSPEIAAELSVQLAENQPQNYMMIDSDEDESRSIVMQPSSKPLATLNFSGLNKFSVFHKDMRMESQTRARNNDIIQID